MQIILALLIIVFLTFSGYHLTFRGFKLPLFAQKMYLTGTEFLFLGLLLGPHFFNLLDEPTIAGLEPLCALLLSWVGLLFGFQFELSKLRRFPVSFFIASLLEGMATFLFVFLGVYLAFPLLQNMGFALLAEISLKMRITIALTLGVAAACTAQTGLALFSNEVVELKRKTLRLLGYISSIDGLSALLIFSIVFFFLPSAVTNIPWVVKSNFGTTAGMAASLGLIFLYLLFLSHRLEEKQLILMVIGMAVLTSGAASIMHFSPLLANFFIGLCLVNFSKEKERIFRILISVEKPVYLLILVFLGARWQIASYTFILLALGYSLCRFVGKMIGGYLVTRINRELTQYPRLLGFGLIDQGGLPIAILFDFQQGFPGEIANHAIGIVLLAIIINGLISPHFFQKLLKTE